MYMTTNRRRDSSRARERRDHRRRRRRRHHMGLGLVMVRGLPLAGESTGRESHELPQRRKGQKVGEHTTDCPAHWLGRRTDCIICLVTVRPQQRASIALECVDAFSKFPCSEPFYPQVSHFHVPFGRHSFDSSPLQFLVNFLLARARAGAGEAKNMLAGIKRRE
ncbi:hypothetical protein MPTK1_4g08860 [Marchantia polymorpha subsp. ruderalis]|uniref:Uncharacterized protein n=2 Tax=Marchantia polymorpha TaxID=3197 RepID=A0AAF6B7W5_MARPO|nr:hypothetical protein MARPO_0188s0008 [Marchantia polymorpha]BBN08099.1 hypothetical protein Mp_4g08860 [Marchantia polymorpha subsp. ruderalis]|eukprot:PTQ27662.1 hypothetical protein MARPO_0188s0008 [Marchantia polymorpha]